MAEAKRWPKRAEAMRSEARDLAEDTIDELRQARAAINRNPLVAEVHIMTATANQERIWRLMEAAKQGQDEE